MTHRRRLEIRLFGGFEASLGGRPLGGFESRKARALFIYLALGRDSAIDRDRLATLLWSERSDESARRNLRQALYSIRSSVARISDGLDPFVESESQAVKLDPLLDVWIDVEAFQKTHREGVQDDRTDVRSLAAAAALYRGDFLAGFYLRDCPEFEDWLIEKQEELREEAVETLRTLVSIYLARGEYRYGIRYARRLLAIDPISEDAHRNLMRLYLMAGRRTRALAQYEHLLNRLQKELGVAPLEETTELYRSILVQQGLDRGQQSLAEPVAPMIPLVGRSRAFVQLQNAWETAAAGTGRLSVLTGEAGIGKSRLAKSFVDASTSRRDATVLRGRCYGASATICLRPFAEIAAAAFNDLLQDDESAREALASANLETLRRLASKAGTDHEADESEARLEALLPEAVAEALFELFDGLCNPQRGRSRPLILLLENFHWADVPSQRLLALLSHGIVERPIWILVTSRSGLSDRLDAASSDSPIALDRLSGEQIEEIASSLVGLSSAGVLAEFLTVYGGGLPLMIAELINLLWDEGKLKSVSAGQWELELRDGERLEAPGSVRELVQRRIERLPTSARRLLAMAAVYGHQFDVELLQEAADEHPSVVETCIELALERWLIRQFPRSWSPAGLERDMVLWARGVRRGFFEFSHDEVRCAILDQINPIRRAVMHRDVALAMEAQLGESAASRSEALAFHWTEANEPQRALLWIEAAARDALRCGDADLRDEYVSRALRVIDGMAERPRGETSEPDGLRSRLVELAAQANPPG
jgi:DNA-binding SARP family transcriptional activator